MLDRVKNVWRHTPGRDLWRQSGVGHSGSRNSGIALLAVQREEGQMLSQLESEGYANVTDGFVKRLQRHKWNVPLLNTLTQLLIITVTHLKARGVCSTARQRRVLPITMKQSCRDDVKRGSRKSTTCSKCLRPKFSSCRRFVQSQHQEGVEASVM